MLSNRARLALTDIRDNIRLAEEFAAGLSVEALKADRRAFYAVTRCLEIISEAARRLPQSLRSRHPELPWRAIMRAGNVYRHDYDNVADARVVFEGPTFTFPDERYDYPEERYVTAGLLADRMVIVVWTPTEDGR